MAAQPASAQSAVDDYTSAIHRALSLVQFAEKGDTPSIAQAVQVLQAAPGPAQPEILNDLRGETPSLVDADQRLQALYQALQQHVDTPDPSSAQRQLNDVLSMPRYAGLTSGPSLTERILSFILGALGRLISWLGVGGLHLNIPVWIWFVLAGLFTLLIILWPLRSVLTPGGREARSDGGPLAPRPSLDFFAEADRLAAAQDYTGAIRALAGGIAVRLSGERVWDHSPYTVRELFSKSERGETLRPLLHLFEESSYGQRRPDASSYARAAEAAAPYRSQAA